MAFDDKNAFDKSKGRVLTADEIVQGVVNAAQTALRVEVSGGGDASAANQVIANASLANIEANTNGGDTTASGTITTQNLVPAGAATAGSAVAISTNGRPAVSVQVTGTYTGALTPQATIDGSVWVTLNGLLNANTGALAATIASAATGIYQIETAGFAQVRLTALAAVTGTATISMRASARMALIGLDAPIPAGTNTIGAVNIAASQTLATVTNVATIGTSVTPGVAAANLGKAEDAVAASGDTGVAVLAVRRDTPSSDVSAAGDYATLQVSANGELWISSAAITAVGAPAATAMTVQGRGYLGTSTVTRAANTTVYTAGDVVGGPLTIATVGPSGGDTFITAVSMVQNISAVPSGQTSFRLYLYNATPPSAIADNSPHTLGAGDRASYLGYIDLGTPALVGTGTGTPTVQADGVNKQFRMPAGTSLFGYLVTNGGFTPAAVSETYTITVNAVSA